MADLERPAPRLVSKTVPLVTVACLLAGCGTAGKAGPSAAVRTFFGPDARKTCSVVSDHYVRSNIAPTGATCVENYTRYTRNPADLRIDVTNATGRKASVTARGRYPSGPFTSKFTLVKQAGKWLIWQATEPQG